MKAQISADGLVKAHSTSPSPSPFRRYSSRAVVPTALLAGILLPLLFVRAAFLALEAGASISESFDSDSSFHFLFFLFRVDYSCFGNEK